MDSKRIYLGLDVGSQRIGLAIGDSIGRIAQPQATLRVDGSEGAQLKTIIQRLGVTNIVVGRPRNQSGDKTPQTRLVEAFVEQTLTSLEVSVAWQDESVTSIIAEERLQLRKKPYDKADIDAEAAAIILQDHLDRL